jgi:hypothetical protein
MISVIPLLLTNIARKAGIVASFIGLCFFALFVLAAILIVLIAI